MIDSIKTFFQHMYDATIGQIIGMWDNFAAFVSQSWDIILLFLILIVGFLVFKFLRYLTIPTIILGQIVFLSGVITGLLAFVALLATSLVSIYNRIYDLANYISSSGGSLSCFGHMMDCLSINGVISSFFTELFALLIVVLLMRISGIFLWAMSYISDKIWRIGVLLGSV